MYRNRNNSYRRGRNNFSRNRSKKRDFIDVEKFISQKSDNTTKKDFIAKNKFSDFNISERIKLNLKKKNTLKYLKKDCIKMLKVLDFFKFVYQEIINEYKFLQGLGEY